MESKDHRARPSAHSGQVHCRVRNVLEQRPFAPFDPDEPMVLREAIRHARSHHVGPAVLIDMRRHAFQDRILDALEAERKVHHQRRNLVVAATGTGKTVVAAFDFKRFFENMNVRLVCSLWRIVAKSLNRRLECSAWFSVWLILANC